jgi:predicted phosphodiesterase
MTAMTSRRSAGRFLLVAPLALALLVCAQVQQGGNGGQPRLVFGVIADVHIGGKPDAAETLEKTLRLLDKRGVDAVLCAGDIAHSGHIGEIEKFAEVWNKVFPGGRGSDGRAVELMISTGNHDVGGWGGRWNGFSEERMLAERFDYKDNFRKTWERLFGMKWELVWRREVKGYTFIGSQWSSLKPPIEEYFRNHAGELRGSKPFFYCQHAHPKDTCHGAYGNGSWDDGASVRALSAFPNAVAFSGHSHRSLADERAVWQGAFTSIGAGCIHEGGLDYNYDNGSAFWHPSFKRNLMSPLQNPSGWGGDDEGGNFEIVEVFDSRLVVHRLSVAYGGEPIAPAWTVPIPAVAGGSFDFAVRKAKRSAPQFSADAKVRIEDCPRGHRLASKARAGEPCVYVSFPAAEPVDGCRVFDYVVTAEAAGVGRVEKKIMAAGFARPGARAGQPGECLFSAAELPKSDRIVFTVVPRDCFGLSGRPISAVR